MKSMTNPIHIRRFLAILFLIAGAALTACSDATPDTPVPLPTARVPSLIEINDATSRWQAGDNRNYFVAVEETTPDGTSMYRVVISDGEIRAAQRADRIDGVWQAPVAIDFETASEYTVDALLARVTRDASGQGAAPLNMFVVFDSISGFPTLVEAKALPSYTGDGGLALNRQHSYTLSVSVDVLIEESFGLNKNPLLTLFLSGGPEAWCSTLRVFDDGSSIYSDNCRQTLLQIRPPQASFEQIQQYAADYAPVEAGLDGDNEYRDLVINGTGSVTPDDAALQDIWDLALSLNDLLSKPIGAGVTMLRSQGDQVVGFDMRTNLEQPANFDFAAPFHGGITDPTGRLLVFADAAGLKWLDTISGDSGTYAGNPTGQHYVPVEYAAGGELILQRFGNGDAPEWGWLSADDRSWHPLDVPGECVTAVSSDPTGPRAVLAAGGEGCEDAAGLWVFDLAGNSGERILSGAAADAAWSPDGEWIAAALDTGDETVSRLVVVHPDGSGLEEVPANGAGRITGVVWGRSGQVLYFGVTGGGEGVDMLIEFDLASGEIGRSLPGSDLTPIAFDPSGEFLAFRDGAELRSWLLAFGQVISISNGNGADSTFIGWIDSTAGQ